MNSSWWEINVRCHPSLEDTVYWRTEQFGCRGTSSESKGPIQVISAYLPQEQAHLLDLSALALWLKQDAIVSELPVPIVRWRIIDEEDWSSSWKDHWEPQDIGDRFAIYPAWIEAPPGLGRKVLRLDPGVAFGTGAHATTQLCLESVEMRLTGEPTEKVVVDIGCGSGILALGALLLGAKKAYCVDIDPLAVRAACQNRSLNGLTEAQMVVEQGSLETLSQLIDGPIDGFFCNILAEIVSEMIPHFASIAKPTTWGIVSGVLIEQSKPIADLFEQHGWIVATLWKRKEWCCFNVRRT